MLTVNSCPAVLTTHDEAAQLQPALLPFFLDINRRQFLEILTHTAQVVARSTL